MKTRTFTADEMKQAARNAGVLGLDNYENGGNLRQAALKHLSEVAMAEIGPGHFADVYDSLGVRGRPPPT